MGLVVIAEFHGKATDGRHESDTVTQVPHDVVAIGPEANDDSGTTEGKNPDGDSRLGPGNVARLPDLVDRSVRTDAVGDVVGAVDE